MADTDAHSIRLSPNSIGALSDYLEQCDGRVLAADRDLQLSAEERLNRDSIINALGLCINIVRIGTTLVFPNGERFGREGINPNLPLRLAIELAKMDLPE